jgi:hypothetical protein
MWSWQTAGLTIAFLIATGKFLESGHVSGRAIERLKVVLIRAYFWLDQIPSRLPKSTFRRYFPVGTLIILFWARRGLVGRIIVFLLAVPFLIVGCLILWALFKGIQLLPSLPAEKVSDPLFLSAVTLPVFEAFLHALLTAFFMLYFSTVITLDLLRAASVRFLDRASAPETKPIGYFTSLLSVFVALASLVGHLIDQLI